MPEEKIKVLLVEDDSMIVKMYKMRFEEEGYAVLVTDKGSEAIEIVEKEKPDIILLDVILPEVDGFTVLQRLKNDTKTKEIPILLLTNLGQESDKEKGLQMGAADYFIKAQHTPVEIIQKIKELINK
ncbi:response regulator [Candidatus Falkowbacteria bacterium]|nr:response regulator [Candidatus Falkowbacteria bacterium]